MFAKICFFGIFGGHWTLGDSGNFNFLIFSRFQNFDFFDFLGGLKILAGGYGAVLVGVSMM